MGTRQVKTQMEMNIILLKEGTQRNKRKKTEDTESTETCCSKELGISSWRGAGWR